MAAGVVALCQKIRRRIAVSIFRGATAHMNEPFNPADYSFAVKRRANPPKPWRWEIYLCWQIVPEECSPVVFGKHGRGKSRREKGPGTLAGDCAKIR